VWTVTGIAMTSAGLVRYALTKAGSLDVMTLPGGSAVTVAVGGFVALDGVSGRI
jgi:hypothetical protein